MQILSTINRQLNLLFEGSPWLDVSYEATLKDIDHQFAARHVIPNAHNIWEIVNHVIFWHDTITRRLSGEKQIQEGDLPDFYMPENTNEENWQATIRHLYNSYRTLGETIIGFPEKRLNEEVNKSGFSYYDNIEGMLQHDTYHLGQIVLLKKFA